MKQVLSLSGFILLLSSCTINNYMGSGPENDDVYYTPGRNDGVFVEEPVFADEPVPASPEDDYWSEDYNNDIYAEGDVYIDNYYESNSGYLWNTPVTRFGVYYPFHTGFSLFYNNFGLNYDPWWGWHAGFGWYSRPMRPWMCTPYDPWWGYGWGNSWYCDPFYYPFGNAWYMNPYNNWGWGYYNNPWMFGAGDTWANGNNSGFHFGHRDPISTESSIGSGYTGTGVYSVGRHYDQTKPLATTRPSDKPLIEREPLVKDKEPSMRLPERPVYESRPVRDNDRPLNRPIEERPVFDRQPDRQPDLGRPDRKPDVGRPEVKPNRDNDRPVRRDEPAARPDRQRDGGGQWGNPGGDRPSIGGGGRQPAGGGGGGSAPSNRGGGGGSNRGGGGRR